MLLFCLQLIMPGYCVAGTIGHKVLSGAKKIEIDKKMVNVRLSVQYMSFRCAGMIGCLCKEIICQILLIKINLQCTVYENSYLCFSIIIMSVRMYCRLIM